MNRVAVKLTSSEHRNKQDHFRERGEDKAEGGGDSQGQQVTSARRARKASRRWGSSNWGDWRGKVGGTDGAGAEALEQDRALHVEGTATRPKACPPSRPSPGPEVSPL